ncbi:MAG TPA: hypothetical protein VLD16_01865 [Gaiellaceae bacterium]|nr:hypothetical protein [Gaiellaceae bacterium]
MAPKRGLVAREDGSVAVTGAARQNRGLREIYVIWLLVGLAAVAVLETYWRFPASRLWNVSGTGASGGVSRAFVFLSFSPALIAIAVLAIVVDRLDDRRATLLGLASLALCATVAIPGVQTPDDLDAKWSNLPAVIGVALAFALTLRAGARGRREAVRTTRGGDVARLVTGAVALFLAAPYIAAELGFFLDGFPLLGSIFQTRRLRPETPGSSYVRAAVHHGHHHGLDGFLLTVTALLLSRLLGGISRRGLRTATAAYLSLMLVYGLTNMANDLWSEQVVKRSWTTWQIPDVLSPTASAAWGAMIACAIVVYYACWRERPLLGRRFGRR